MSKLITNITLGADPELFLKQGDEIISAEGLIGGTKHEPKMISDEGHAIQEDNIMIEFNIPPSETKESFVANINHVLEYLTILAKQQDCTLSIVASSVIDKKYLQTEQATMFGCDPDFNVYIKDINTPPDAKSNLRTAGGHIHVGFTNKDNNQEISELLVYAMDATLGLESINLDKDDRRREMYGNAGSFRFKEYGIEYRTLSNFWIQNDELKEWAYTKTLEAIELVNSGLINEILSKYESQIRDIIDNNKKEEATSLLKQIAELKIEKLIKTN